MSSTTGARGMPLGVIASLAGRNLGRRRRRTALAAASAGASAAAIVFFLGFYRGSYEEMFYSGIIDYQTAHAQIQSPGLDPEEPERWVRESSMMRGWEAAAAAARAAPGVAGAAPRLELAALAGDGTERMPALVAGVDFGAERGVSLFCERLREGSLPAAPGEALIGDELADLFGLRPGSAFLVQAQTSRGAPNISRLAVSGIYDTRFAALDSSFVAVPLSTAQDLADASGAINRIYVKLESTAGLRAAMPGLGAAAASISAEARPWQSYAREAIDHARNETSFYYVFLAILIALSGEAIGSTMRAVARERTREIGAMRAVGWSAREVFSLFALESGAVGLVGAAAGAAIGGLASALMAAFPIDVSSMGEASGLPFFAMTSSSRPSDFLMGIGIGVVAAVVAGAAPARAAARTDIVAALSSH